LTTVVYVNKHARVLSILHAKSGDFACKIERTRECLFMYVHKSHTHTHTHKEIWPIINEALN